ncbi:MAG: LamG domain-containing protein, partial [Planctomycetes bacterium]|nr:LamG domain-containing protein [Planctomycetota bacterium]
ARGTAVGWYGALTANRWYHVVVAYDGRRLQLIVDGTVVDAQEASGEIESAGPLCVSDQAASFNGVIDEVSIYSEGRLAKETAVIAPANNTPNAAAEYLPGKVGDCLRVERNGYVEVSVPERLRTTRELTIDTWVCPAVVDDGNNHIILAMQTWVSPGAYCLHINDKQLDRALVFMAYNQANAAKSVAWKGALEAERWYHVVVVYDGKEMRLYVDGDLKASAPHTGELGAAGPIRISDSPLGPFLSGRIDELRIYDKALDVDAQGNVRADIAPVLCFPFEKRADEVVPDASGHGHHGQLVKPQRPYEMLRAGRREERTPLVDFEDVSGWEVAQHFGARCALRRSQLQQMWGSYVAEVTYSGSSRASYAELRPKKPIPIQGEFDCVNLWVYGDWWGYSTQRKTLADLGITPASLAVRL